MNEEPGAAPEGGAGGAAVESAPAAEGAEGSAAPAEAAPGAAWETERATLIREGQAKLARALASTNDLERAKHESAQKIREYEERYKDVDPDEFRKFQKYMSDPAEMIRDGVLTQEQLTELNTGSLSGDLSVRTAADNEAAAARKEAAEAKAQLEELKAELGSDKQSAAVEADSARLREAMAAEEGGYPLLLAFDRADGITKDLHAYAAENGGQMPSNEAIFEHMATLENALVNDALKVLGNPKGLEAVLKNDEMKAALAAALSPADPADETTEPAQQEIQSRASGTRNEPRTLTDDTVARTATRTNGPRAGRRENRANAIAIAQKVFQTERE